MPKIALYAGGDLSGVTIAERFDLYVGVDRACLFLLEHQLPLDWAVGDFDSVTAAEFDYLRTKAKKLIQAPAEKDDTDTELALKLIFEQYPEAQVTVFGAFGGRMDHLLSNVFLPSDPQLAPYMTQISLLDEQNTIYYRPAGSHRIFPSPDRTYVSFLVEGGGQLSIDGARYNLNPANFFTKKIYSSNEFTNDSIEVMLDKGYLVVLQTRDRR